jgi:hypothetical protein
MAPLGNGSVSSPVETPGFVNQGTLAPGTDDIEPMLFLSHSDHILKKGSKDISGPALGKPITPPLPPESVITLSSYLN